MIRLLSYFFALTFLLACTDRDDELGAVNIRIKNASEIQFDEVQVGEQENPYLNIEPGAYSEYQEYATAYRYANITITSGEETYVLQPIDFVGEEELPLGLYTYELNVNAEGEVSLNFEAD